MIKSKTRNGWLNPKRNLPDLIKKNEVYQSKEELNALVSKFMVPRSELENEVRLSEMTPRDKVKKESIDRYINTKIKHAVDELNAGNHSDGAHADLTAKIYAYEVIKLQSAKEDHASSVDKDFKLKFYKWLSGNGEPEDVLRTPWGNQRIPDEEVEAYLVSFLQAKLDFTFLLQDLVIKAYNGGGLQGIKEHYLFYKYIVAGGWESADMNDYMDDYSDYFGGPIDEEDIHSYFTRLFPGKYPNTTPNEIFYNGSMRNLTVDSRLKGVTENYFKTSKSKKQRKAWKRFVKSKRIDKHNKNYFDALGRYIGEDKYPHLDKRKDDEKTCSSSSHDEEIDYCSDPLPPAIPTQAPTSNLNFSVAQAPSSQQYQQPMPPIFQPPQSQQGQQQSQQQPQSQQPLPPLPKTPQSQQGQQQSQQQPQSQQVSEITNTPEIPAEVQHQINALEDLNKVYQERALKLAQEVALTQEKDARIAQNERERIEKAMTLEANKLKLKAQKAETAAKAAAEALSKAGTNATEQQRANAREKNRLLEEKRREMGEKINKLQDEAETRLAEIHEIQQQAIHQIENERADEKSHYEAQIVQLTQERDNLMNEHTNPLNFSGQGMGVIVHPLIKIIPTTEELVNRLQESLQFTMRDTSSFTRTSQKINKIRSNIYRSLMGGRAQNQNGISKIKRLNRGQTRTIPSKNSLQTPTMSSEPVTPETSNSGIVQGVSWVHPIVHRVVIPEVNLPENAPHSSPTGIVSPLISKSKKAKRTLNKSVKSARKSKGLGGQAVHPQEDTVLEGAPIPNPLTPPVTPVQAPAPQDVAERIPERGVDEVPPVETGQTPPEVVPVPSVASIDPIPTPVAPVPQPSAPQPIPVTEEQEDIAMDEIPENPQAVNLQPMLNLSAPIPSPARSEDINQTTLMNNVNTLSEQNGLGPIFQTYNNDEEKWHLQAKAFLDLQSDYDKLKASIAFGTLASQQTLAPPDITQTNEYKEIITQYTTTKQELETKNSEISGLTAELNRIKQMIQSTNHSDRETRELYAKIERGYEQRLEEAFKTELYKSKQVFGDMIVLPERMKILDITNVVNTLALTNQALTKEYTTLMQNKITEVDTLKTALNAIKSAQLQEHSSLTFSVAKSSDAIQQIQTATTLQKSVTETKSVVKEAVEAIEEIISIQHGKKKIDTTRIEASIEAMEKIPALKEELKSARKTIQLLKRNYTDMENDRDARKTQVATLDSNVRYLNNEVEKLKGSMSEKDKTILQLQNDINQHKQSLLNQAQYIQTSRQSLNVYSEMDAGVSTKLNAGQQLKKNYEQISSLLESANIPLNEKKEIYKNMGIIMSKVYQSTRDETKQHAAPTKLRYEIKGDLVTDLETGGVFSKSLLDNLKKAEAEVASLQKTLKSKSDQKESGGDVFENLMTELHNAKNEVALLKKKIDQKPVQTESIRGYEPVNLFHNVPVTPSGKLDAIKDAENPDVKTIENAKIVIANLEQLAKLKNVDTKNIQMLLEHLNENPQQHTPLLQKSYEAHLNRLAERKAVTDKLTAEVKLITRDMNERSKLQQQGKALDLLGKEISGLRSKRQTIMSEIQRIEDEKSRIVREIDAVADMMNNHHNEKTRLIMRHIDNNAAITNARETTSDVRSFVEMAEFALKTDKEDTAINGLTESHQLVFNDMERLKALRNSLAELNNNKEVNMETYNNLNEQIIQTENNQRIHELAIKNRNMEYTRLVNSIKHKYDKVGSRLVDADKKLDAHARTYANDKYTQNIVDREKRLLVEQKRNYTHYVNEAMTTFMDMYQLSGRKKDMGYDELNSALKGYLGPNAMLAPESREEPNKLEPTPPDTGASSPQIQNEQQDNTFIEPDKTTPQLAKMENDEEEEEEDDENKDKDKDKDREAVTKKKPIQGPGKKARRKAVGDEDKYDMDELVKDQMSGMAEHADGTWTKKRSGPEFSDLDEYSKQFKNKASLKRHLSGVAGSLVDNEKDAPSYLTSVLGGASNVLFGGFKIAQTAALTSLGFIKSTQSGDYTDITDRTIDIITKEINNSLESLNNAAAFKATNLFKQLTESGLAYNDKKVLDAPDKGLILKIVDDFEKYQETTETTYTDLINLNVYSIERNGEHISRIYPDANLDLDGHDNPSKKRKTDSGVKPIHKNPIMDALMEIVVPNQVSGILSRVKEVRQLIQTNSDTRKSTTSKDFFTKNPEEWRKYVESAPRYLQFETKTVDNLKKLMENFSDGMESVMNNAEHEYKETGVLSDRFKRKYEQKFGDLTTEILKKIDLLDPGYERKQNSIKKRSRKGPSNIHGFDVNFSEVQ
jgi:hypothetical protein